MNIRHQRLGSPPRGQIWSRGFTLIELLVVVALISLIIAMLLPALSKVRQASHLTVCASNQGQLGAALHTYMLEHQQSFPPKYSGSQFSWWGQSGTGSGYGNTAADSMGPEDRVLNTWLGGPYQFGAKLPMTLCPADTGGKSSTGVAFASHGGFFGTSYGSNTHTSEIYGGVVDMSGGNPGRGRTIRAIRSPARMVVAADNGAYGPQWWTASQWNTHGGGAWYWHGAMSWNLMFADGHVALTQTIAQTLSTPTYTFHRHQ